MYAQLVTRSSLVSRSSSTEAAVLKSSRTNTTWINRYIRNNRKNRAGIENSGFLYGLIYDKIIV